MSEHSGNSAVIIPFPKRHRAINPVIPQLRPELEQFATPPAPAVTARAKPAAAARPGPVDTTSVTSRVIAPAPAGIVPLAAGATQAAKRPAPNGSGATQSLARVMADLDTALTQQSAAVARWRNAIQELRTAIDGLDGSLRQYRDRLAPIGKGMPG